MTPPIRAPESSESSVGLNRLARIAGHHRMMTQALADRTADHALALIGVANVAFVAAFFLNLLVAAGR